MFRDYCIAVLAMVSVGRVVTEPYSGKAIYILVLTSLSFG